jgi:hypothetical protein
MIGSAAEGIKDPQAPDLTSKSDCAKTPSILARKIRYSPVNKWLFPVIWLEL